MPTAPSLFSLMAACFYGIVACSALLALRSAVVQRQIGWHRIAWAFVAALFVGLAIMRLFVLEELLRHTMRSSQWMQERYAERRAIQTPIAAALVIVAGLAAAFLGLRLAPGLRSRRTIAALAALGASGGLIVLVLMRIVSLHAVDALLYGPLKLNWVLDLGASAAVLLASIAYLVVTHRRR